MEAIAEKYSRLSDVWAQEEHKRECGSFNEHDTPNRKLCKAAAEFESGRPWPSYYESYQGPRPIWTMFLYFIGVTNYCPNFGDWLSDDDDDDGNRDTLKDLPYWLPDAGSRLARFISSPVKVLALFLSAHARHLGIIWSDLNLYWMPIVVEFFVKFLIRNLAWPGVESDLLESLDLLEAAKTQLPATAIISKAWPDSFSRGCVGCFGWQTGWQAGPPSPSLSTTASAKSMGEAPVNELEPDVDNSREGGVWDPPVWPRHADPWISSPGGREIPLPSEDPDPNYKSAIWTPAENNNDSLLPVLGPTVLGLTHQVGVVEQSMRRIKAIHPPETTHPLTQEIAGAPNACAVETELRRSFARLVLEPVPSDWDGGLGLALSKPQILKTSKEPPPTKLDNVVTNGEVLLTKKDITLLVDVKDLPLALFSSGMGLGGTWVHLLRHEAFQDKQGDAAEFWYLDNFTSITPSFWCTDV